MTNPDNRSDNVARIADAIQDTMENRRESEDFLAAHGSQMRNADKAALEAKNKRRSRAIEGFREEIRDEVADQKNQD